MPMQRKFLTDCGVLESNSKMPFLVKFYPHLELLKYGEKKDILGLMEDDNINFNLIS